MADLQQHEEYTLWLKAAEASLNSAALFLRRAGIQEFDEQLTAMAADIRRRVQEEEQQTAEAEEGGAHDTVTR